MLRSGHDKFIKNFRRKSEKKTVGHINLDEEDNILMSKEIRREHVCMELDIFYVCFM